MLRLPVLVRGINNLSDARYCAGMGADGLVFTLDPTLPNAVDAATVKELAGWVAGVEIIGEFGPQVPVSEINRLIEDCDLGRVLLHHLPESPLRVPALLHLPADLRPDNALNADTQRQYATLFPAGFGLVAPATDFAVSATPVNPATAPWLSGFITPAQVAQLLDTARPAGLILEGGDEIKPGLRDFEELEAVFEALEE